MEIRFFAPGSLVSNLDFVERIFGNGGDPYLPENDAALDVLHWTGHTGCVILAPHIVGMKKKELGLPHFDQATERQRRDGMCWREDGRAVQQRRRVQAGLPRPPRRDGHDHRRQLLRLLQEGSQDARSATPPICSGCARKSTPAAPSRFPPMCWARSSTPAAPCSSRKH